MQHRRGPRAAHFIAAVLFAVASPVAVVAQAQSQASNPISDAANAALEALRGRPFVASTATWAQESTLAAPSGPVSVGSGAIVKVATTSPSGPAGPVAGGPGGPETGAEYVYEVAPVPPQPLASGDVYALSLRQLAQQVAKGQKSLDPAALEGVWSRTSAVRMTAVLSALAQVGIPYRWAGTDSSGFDCSGLTGFAWANAGVRLKRTSTDQIGQVSPRSADRLLPGDLVWRPGHISMYLGHGEAVIAAPQTGKNVGVRQWGRVQRFGSPLADG